MGETPQLVWLHQGSTRMGDILGHFVLLLGNSPHVGVLVCFRSTILLVNECVYVNNM